MTDTPRPTRYQEVSERAASILTLGESGGHEFKRDAEAVSVGLLAALANWVAMSDDREVAHLLVGVDEVEDVATGLVTGQPCGLAKGLDRAVSRIQDMASKTYPIPVDVFIVEEGVAGPAPFLRVEVRPTMPPHYDDGGRRQTRQNRSTRALTDDELLGVYLQREAGSFAARFRQAGDQLRDAVGVVGTQVDRISAAIEERIARPLTELQASAVYAASAAGGAEDAANAVQADVVALEQVVRQLQRVVETLQDETLETLAARVVRRRQQVWLRFSLDTWERSSARANKIADSLGELLMADIPVDAARNAWELRVWDDLLLERKGLRRGIGTLKWWDEAIGEVRTFVANPVYGVPDLPDIRAELRADVDGALDDPHSIVRTFAEEVEL